MFYEESKIKTILDCKNCNQRLDTPRVLPCGSNLCSSCVSKLTSEMTDEFACLTCSKKHTMPKDGFPINEALVSLLQLEPNEISRGDVAKNLRNQLFYIQKDLDHFTSSLEDGVDVIKEHCCNLKNQVQLASEQIILEINTSNEKFISKIEKYEKQCIQIFESKRNEKNELNILIEELKMFHKEWDTYLKELKINDQLMKEASESASCLAEKSNKNKLVLDALVFGGNRLRFIKNNEICGDDLIGKLTSPIPDLDSTILNQQQKKTLLDLCGFTNNYLKLIYRGSRDGYNSNTFHSLCDHKPNTFILIRSNYNYIFGGYTEQDWSGNGYKTDSKAFLFGLVGAANSKPQIFRNNYGSNSIYCINTYGPTFGSGHDILISNNCNSNNNSSNPNLFGLPSNTCLAGNSFFTVTEIEVFSKEL